MFGERGVSCLHCWLPTPSVHFRLFFARPTVISATCAFSQLLVTLDFAATEDLADFTNPAAPHQKSEGVHRSITLCASIGLLTSSTI